MSTTSIELVREQHAARRSEAEQCRRAGRVAAAQRLQRRAERLSQRAERVTARAERAASRARVAVAQVL
ncbi:hypothetical protein SAMN04488570_3485 [Nocardioides scoriae]|uniref:Uncharacterized protein n=1 Tax=Nocardioides scoriae TaxID=642780 RepID=A0A1H1XGX6_9ACTN|nr:hypothetical protein [Nocardioides scoriae]SDT08535.1 hypothetical protein SAMN04488570_3485 [Nocardioides scoriae]